MDKPNRDLDMKMHVRGAERRLGTRGVLHADSVTLRRLFGEEELPFELQVLIDCAK